MGGEDKRKSSFRGTGYGVWLERSELKHFCFSDREELYYSGSDNDEEEVVQPGEPSSIIQAPTGDTLKRNFQQIQVGLALFYRQGSQRTTQNEPVLWCPNRKGKK